MWEKGLARPWIRLFDTDPLAAWRLSRRGWDTPVPAAIAGRQGRAAPRGLVGQLKPSKIAVVFDATGLSVRAILFTRRQPRSRRRPRGRRPFNCSSGSPAFVRASGVVGRDRPPGGGVAKRSRRLRAASGLQLYPSSGLRHWMHPATARSGLGQWRSRGPQDHYPGSRVTNKRCKCAVFEPREGQLQPDALSVRTGRAAPAIRFRRRGAYAEGVQIGRAAASY